MRIIDLSHTIYTGMPSFPSSKHVKTEIKQTSDINIEGVERHQILMSCHSGTHMDSPLHMVVGGKSLDKIPLDHFVGNVKKILISKENQSDKEIKLEEVNKHNIEGIDFLIVQTEWEKRWQDKSYYEDNPYFSLKAMQYLADSKLKGLLLDLPNIDAFTNKDYSIHKVWLTKKMMLVENLCNLDQIEQGKVYQIIIAPLNLIDTEASPVRCLILVN